MRGIAVERYRIRREDSAGFFPDATAAKSPKFKPGNVMMMNNQNREHGRAASQSAAYKK
jgi:hypothetical protein